MKMFSLGQVVATPQALECIRDAGQSPLDFLKLHSRCDWGVVSEEDKALNDHALEDGGRLLSAYETSREVRLWVLTEAEDDEGQRSATTILLPDEY